MPYQKVYTKVSKGRKGDNSMAVLEKTERHTPPEVKRTRGKWLRLLTGDQLQMQTMIWPGLILCFIFCYIPMYGIIIAFKDYNILSTVTGADWVGLKYFREFFFTN